MGGKSRGQRPGTSGLFLPLPVPKSGASCQLGTLLDGVLGVRVGMLTSLAPAMFNLLGGAA